MASTQPISTLPNQLITDGSNPPTSAISELVDVLRSGGSPSGQRTGEALQRTHDHLDGLGDSYASLLQYLGPFTAQVSQALAVTIPASNTTYVLLVGLSQVLTYANPSNAGDGLTYLVQQDGSGSGGYGVVWDTNLLWAPTVIDNTPNSAGVYEFRALVDPGDSILKWFCVSSNLGH